MRPQLTIDPSPHIAMVNSEKSFAWVMEHLDDLLRYRIGHVWLWGSPWVYGTGSTPTPQGYSYCFPREIGLLKAECRRRSIYPWGYWSPTRWLKAGLDYDLAARNIHELDLVGVIIDDGPLPSDDTPSLTQMWEFWDFVRYLKAEGYLLAHHCSVEPFLGRINWTPPWGSLFDVHMWGETNPVPDGDGWWRLRRLPGRVSFMLPKNDEAKQAELKANPLLWIEPALAVLGRRLIWRGYSQGAAEWRTFTEDFLPRWEACRSR